MRAAAELRKQIESALAGRIPAALSWRPLHSPELLSCGVDEVDALLGGGLPPGSIVELTGNRSSGRTTLALSSLAELTRQGHCCAYVDASDTLDPLSAAALGVELHRLLWVRPKSNLRPRSNSWCPTTAAVGRCGTVGSAPRSVDVGITARSLDAALRATDLLLSTGGWGALVLDLGELPPELARRVPMATWYRFRLQAEKSRTLLLLITNGSSCSQSCAAVSLHCHLATPVWRRAVPQSPPLLAGLHYRFSLERRRAAAPKKPAASQAEPLVPHLPKEGRYGAPSVATGTRSEAASGGQSEAAWRSVISSWAG
jgi:hypothetical protein